jgi:hypothetical protein
VSETAPEKPSGGGGNVFTRKLGPLQMWMWMLIVAFVAVLYHLYSKSKSSSSTTSGGSTAGTGGSAGTTDQSLVPQFVNQTYTNSTAPAAPSVITLQNGGTSSAGGTITMPNVVGQDTTQAQAALKGAGLSQGSLSGPKASKGQQQVVAFQNPSAGVPVSPTTPVTLGYETITPASGKTPAKETQLVNGKPVTKTVTKTTTPNAPAAGT